MSVNLGYIQKLTSPNPFALISTRKADGSTNLMAVSWWTYASNHPATIAVCISRKSFSGELIRNNQEFGLNIVDACLKEAAFLCGTCSGRVENKPEKFGIELVPSIEISTMLVKESKVSLECRLNEFIEVSDHIIYIAEVVESRTDPDRTHLYSINGYSALDSL